MSKIDSSGMKHGKQGDKIYVVLHGQQIEKALYRPSNPRTPAQQKHRAKLAFANRLSSLLSEAIALGFSRAAGEQPGLSPRNLFVRTNWNNGAFQWNDETALWQLCPEHLLLAIGPRYVSPSMSAAIENNLLLVSCPDLCLAERYAAPDDQLILVAYLSDVQSLVLYHGPLRADSAQCAFELPASHSQMHLYAWFQATRFHRATASHAQVHPAQSSPSLYLGTFSL